MKIKLHLLFCLASIYCVVLPAQDIHLSHIHASPTLLNPSMNGLFDGDIRFIANMRSQWNSMTKGYKTAIASMDMKLMGIGKQDYLSGGVQVYVDRAGDLDFSTRSAGLALSYLRALDGRGKSFVAFGVQSNFVNNSVDYSKIVAFEEIPALSRASLVDNINYFDLNVGLSWYQKIDRDNGFFLGISAFHVNKPIVSFDNRDKTNRQHTMYRKFTVHGGAHLKMSAAIDIKPNFIFTDQGPHREITLGSYVRYRTVLNKKNKRKKPLYFVYLGAWIRSYVEHDVSGVDSIIASLRFDYKTLYLAFSYDINISKWLPSSQGRGGPEVSVIKILNTYKNYRKNTRVKCPVNFF